MSKLDVLGALRQTTIAIKEYVDSKIKALSDSSVTEPVVSGWGFTKNTGDYSKPSGGIPKSDLTSEIQMSLGKADTALQSYTEQYTGTVKSVNGKEPDTNGNVSITMPNGGLTEETDPVFTASVAYGITQSDINNWNGKTSNTGTVKSVNGTTPDSSGNVTIPVPSPTIVNQEFVEVGTKDGWTYKKWANGLYECEYNGTITTSINTTWGNTYRSASTYGEVQYPITFTTLPNVQITLHNASDITNAQIMGGSTAVSPKFYLWRGGALSSSLTFVYSIKVTGTWKTLVSGSIGVPRIVGAADIVNAADIPYDNSTSGLAATEVQCAIDEIASHIPIVEGGKSSAISTTYNSTGTYTITFGKTFKSAPAVSVMLRNSNTSAGRYIVYSLDSVTATQAVVRWRNTATATSSANYAATFDWIAVGV